MAALPLGIRLFGGICENRTVQRKTQIYKVFILFATFFTYCSYHLSRKPISVVKNVLHENSSKTSNCSGFTNCSWPPFENDNSAELLGSLDYAFLFTYALGMFCSGHIAERVNLRYFLTFGMVMCGVFTVLFGMARYWDIHMLWYFIVVQILNGLFQSTGWPSVVACMANWFGKGNRGLIMGVWNSHTSFGNILGTVIPAVFVDYNWGLSFIVPGAIIFGMGIFVFLFLVPHPTDVGLPDPNRMPKTLSQRISDSEEGVSQSINERQEAAESEALIPKATPEAPPEKAVTFCTALLIPGVIEFSLCLFFAKLVSYTFLFWLPNYIAHSNHKDASSAAYLSTAFDFGGILGAMTAGFISDRTGKSATTCLVMFVFAAPALFCYEQFGHTNLPLSVILMMIAGALVNGPYGLITTAVSADLGTHECLRGSAKALATVTAIIDGTGSMGAALGPLLTGVIQPTGWANVFYMLIAADACAFLLLLRLGIKEIRSYCRTGRQSQFPEYPA